MTILDFVCLHPLAAAALGFGILWSAPFIGTITAAIKSAFDKLIEAFVQFVCTTIQMDDDAAQCVVLFLRNECPSLGMGEDHVSGETCYTRGRGNRLIFFKTSIKSRRVFLYNGAPILASPKKKKKEGEAGAGEFSLRFLRGTVDLKQLMVDSAEHYQDWMKSRRVKGSRFYIVKLSGNTRRDDDIKGSSGHTTGYESALSSGPLLSDKEPINCTVEDLKPMPRESALAILSQTPVHKQLLRDVKFWKDNQAWYTERGLTWKRGYLLYGQPGTGKTSLVRALAQDFDIPIYIFNLASMQESQFQSAWDSTKSVSPRIVLLEDFDTVFKGRVNQNKYSTLTFSTVLNCIDGVEPTSGMLLFVTTNVVEDIDPALGRPNEQGESTRPGRIDVVTEIPHLDHAGRVKIAMRILRDETLANELASEYLTDTPVQFTERCKAKALKSYWETHFDSEAA